MRRSENQAAILADLRGRGVMIELVEGVMRCRVPQGLPEEIKEALRIIRPGVTEALRREAGLCIECGVCPATRLRVRGRRNVSEEACATFLNLDIFCGWHDPPVWEDLETVSPPLWCEECWHAGAWKNGLRVAEVMEASLSER